MEKIEIRQATAGDAPVIHRLLAELEHDLGVQGTIRRKAGDILRYGFSETPLFEALIAWKGAQPVGLALYFSEFSTWRGSPGVYVQDLYVSAQTRGAGLGQALMQAVFARARNWGATYCKLAVYNNNEAAISFYRHIGFHVSENESVLFMDGL